MFKLFTLLEGWVQCLFVCIILLSLNSEIMQWGMETSAQKHCSWNYKSTWKYFFVLLFFWFYYSHTSWDKVVSSGECYPIIWCNFTYFIYTYRFFLMQIIKVAFVFRLKKLFIYWICWLWCSCFTNCVRSKVSLYSLLKPLLHFCVRNKNPLGWFEATTFLFFIFLLLKSSTANTH